MKLKVPSIGSLGNLYWKKAYVTALRNITVTSAAGTNQQWNKKAKEAADQYIADYKLRKDVPDFQLNVSMWGNAYFAVIGVISPDKCGDLADTAVNDFTDFKSK